MASGTLYRHFPTRLDLIEAVLAGQIAELAGLGRRLLTATDELDALSSWLRAAIMHALTYRGLAATVMNSALDRDDGLVSTWHAELFEVGAALLARARRSGAVAADVDPAEPGPIRLAPGPYPRGPTHWAGQAPRVVRDKNCLAVDS